jgi:hypothetical protein
MKHTLRYYLIVIFMLLPPLAASSFTDLDLKNIISEFSEKNRITVSIQDKDAFIQRIKSVSRESMGESEVHELTRLLLYLGDKEAIDTTIEKLKTLERYSEPFRLLERSYNPAIIPNLAPLLEKNEPAASKFVTEDIVQAPLSMAAAYLMQRIALTAPEFPPEVKSWVEPFPDIRGHEFFRDMMRVWWKANEEAIRAGRWEDVKPGSEKPVFRREDLSEK